MNDIAKRWDGPPLEAWQAWSPCEVAQLLAGVDAPWCVVGGWAIDLFLGRETRAHEDIEIAVPRGFFPPLRRHLEGRYTLYVVGDGETRRLTPGEPFPPDRHQCWLLEEAANKWRLDIMQEPGDADHWVCRRDDRLSLPRAGIQARTAHGIPYLAPEAVLLFKAKYRRPKDETDFANCLTKLSGDARRWLAEALVLVHPGHAWIEPLRDAS